MGIQLLPGFWIHFYYLVVTATVCCLLCGAIWHMPNGHAWKPSLRRVTYAVMLLVMISVPRWADAKIITCKEAAIILADFARNWRDKGIPLEQAQRELEHANYRGNVGNIQMDRLRYELRGIYEDYTLRLLSPKEVRLAYLNNCPSEFTP